MSDALQLHVFTSGDEWVIAASAEDAAELARADYGHERGDECGGDAEDYDQLADDRALKVSGWEPAESDEQTEKTCADWCALAGRGLLASTEF